MAYSRLRQYGDIAVQRKIKEKEKRTVFLFFLSE
jgi:hypothetical protein